MSYPGCSIPSSDALQPKTLCEDNDPIDVLVLMQARPPALLRHGKPLSRHQMLYLPLSLLSAADGSSVPLRAGSFKYPTRSADVGMVILSRSTALIEIGQIGVRCRSCCSVDGMTHEPRRA